MPKKPVKKRLKDQKNGRLKRMFYVCSYGGSGSKMFCRYLNSFGHTKHIHSRYPPQYLEHVGHPLNSEWFNENKIDEDKIPYYTVIYIYRDPIKATLSRHRPAKRDQTIIKRNLVNIQVAEEYQSLSYNDLLESGKDLYGLEDFFDNYVSENYNKNYDIVCIKYETLWDNLSKINKILDIPDMKHKYPTRIEKTRTKGRYESEKLYKIYTPLIRKMSKLPFIYINKASHN